MSKQTAKSLFIDSSMLRFYQHLLRGIASFEELGNGIIKRIKAAHAFRQVEQVRELAKLLVNIPIKEYQVIAQYYLIWCGCRELRFNNAALESVIEQTLTYKVKALSSRGTFEWYKGNNEAALYFYTEALKASPAISEYIDLLRAIAVLKAQEGFHKRSVKELEKLIPLIRYAEPLAHHELLNTYAIELGEVGRKDEARNVIKHVLASPFIHAYPEWQETAQELKEPNRSLVTVPLIKRERVSIKTTAAKPVRKKAKPKPADKVLPFKLKEVPQPEKPDRMAPQEIGQLTASDKRELILAAIRSGAIGEDDYDRMMFMLGMLKSGPADKILDLEDDEVLDDIAVIWSVQIGAEELVGFLSALRDCDDSLRQYEILDRLIRKIFHHTQLCSINEDEWRLKVERRLPKR